MKHSNLINRFLSLLCLCLMCFSAAKLFFIWQEYHAGDSAYTDIYKQVGVNEPASGHQSPASNNPVPSKDSDSAVSETPEQTDESASIAFRPVDLEALARINKDAYAWISIPGTQIDYPILRSKDNQDYLRTTPDGKKLKAGSIFTDYRCKEPFKEANTIIYGHNLLDGTMFSSLTKYKEESYLKAHPEIFIQTADCTYVYEIYSCYITDGNSKTYSFQLKTGSEDYENYLKMTTKHSLTKNFQKQIPTPEKEEKIITLSTCTNRTEEERFVVHARFKDHYSN